MADITTEARYRRRFPDDEMSSEVLAMMLEEASAKVRRALGGRADSLDDDEDLATVAESVALRAVHRAVAGPSALTGYESYQQTGGPYSVMVRPANAFGEVYLSASELDELSPATVAFVGMA